MSETKIVQRRRQTKPVVEQCPCCLEKYTDVRRRCFQCRSCQYKVCTACLEKFLLTISDLHCMNCRTIFLIEEIKDYFPDAFLHKRLYDHHVDILLSLEKSLMPETIQHVRQQELEAEAQRNRELLSNLLDKSQNLAVLREDVERAPSINMLLPRTNGEPFPCDPVKRVKLMEALRDKLKLCELNHLHIPTYLNSRSGLMYMLRDYNTAHGLQMTKQELLEALDSISLRIETRIIELTTGHGDQAPVCLAVRCKTEKCPGYLVITQVNDKNVGECKVCHTYQCPHCLVRLDDLKASQTHTCDPDLLKTIRMIERSTRPCPNCKQSIEKTSGCDQMFCTQCCTAFDWSSNQIIQGRIHNPHYQEWLDKQSKQKPVEPSRNRVNILRETSDDDSDDDEEYQPPKTPTSLDLTGFFFSDQNYVYFTSLFSVLKTLRYNEWSSIPNMVFAVNLQKTMYMYWALISDIKAVVDNGMPNMVEQFRDKRIKFYQGRLTEKEWRSQLAHEKRRLDVRIQRLKLFTNVILEGEEVFKELIAQLELHRGKVKEDAVSSVTKYLVPSLESAFEKARTSIRKFNAASSELSGLYNINTFTLITIPTMTMLCYDMMLSIRFNYQKQYAELDTNPTSFQYKNRIIIKYDVPRTSNFVDYDTTYQNEALQTKDTIVSKLAEQFKLQRHDNNDMVLSDKLTPDEQYFMLIVNKVRDWEVKLRKLLHEADAQGIVHLTKDKVEQGIVLFEQMMADNWHVDYLTKLAEALERCRKRKLSRDVLMQAYMSTSSSYGSCLITFRSFVFPVVLDMCWDAHEETYLKSIKQPVLSMWRSDMLRVFYALKDRHTRCSGCYVEESMARCSKLDKELSVGMYQREDIPHDLPDFNLKTKEEVKAELMKAEIDKVIKSLKKFMLSDPSSSNMKTLEINTDKFASESVETLYETWRLLKKTIFFTNDRSPNLELSMGFHVSRQINGYNMSVPRWYAFMLDRQESFVSDFMIVGRDFVTSSNDRFDLLWTSSVFSVYLDGEQCTYDELIYVKYLDVDWTLEVQHEMFEKLLAYDNNQLYKSYVSRPSLEHASKKRHRRTSNKKFKLANCVSSKLREAVLAKLRAIQANESMQAKTQTLASCMPMTCDDENVFYVCNPYLVDLF